MKLSTALYEYYILPMNQSEIVGFHSDQYDVIRITWTDSDTMDQNEQDFDDQEIDPSSDFAGLFTVTDQDGEPRQFIALDGVRLAP